MKKIKILGVTFDVVTQQEAIQQVFSARGSHQQHSIVTPNPEMLLESRKNLLFREMLNKAFLSIPDGIGILWASTFLEKTKRNSSSFVILLKGFWYLLALLIMPSLCRSVFPERVSGADLFKKLAKECDSRGFTMFLLGAQPGIAETVKMKLEKEGIASVVGTYSGSPKEESFSHIQNLINQSKPDFLCVAFGAPAQETWIEKHLPHLPSVKWAMGVGGTFDFLAGIRKRAPLWMQKLGLEWLFRLIQQPSRWKRIYHATMVFPGVILRSRLSREK